MTTHDSRMKRLEEIIEWVRRETHNEGGSFFPYDTQNAVWLIDELKQSWELAEYYRAALLNIRSECVSTNPNTNFILDDVVKALEEDGE